MHLRKILVSGAAVLAAGVMSLGATAQATTPHGPIADVEVNGNIISAPVDVDGPFKGGTATFAGFTATCSGGNVDGTVNPMPNPGFTFDTLNLSCTSFLPGTVAMSLTCPVTVAMTDNEVHTGLNSTMADSISNGNGNVTGVANMSTCAGGTPSVSVSVGPCSFKVGGSIAAQFNELPKTVGSLKYQDLILNGAGLTTSGASIGCFGAIPNGTGITLNDITFGIQVAGGSADGIDFYGS